MNITNLVFLLTLIYFFIVLIGGLYYNSLALVTDSAFIETNIVNQAIAIYSMKLSYRPPDKNKTFGYERAKVLSGLFNGILVGFMLSYVLINAYRRINNPQSLDTDKVFVIVLIGLFETVTAYLNYTKFQSI